MPFGHPEASGEDPPLMSFDSGSDTAGPTPDDLAAIEAEWPLIAAEMDLVAAEIRVLTAISHPTDLDWRRLRRAEARVCHEAAVLLFARRAASLAWPPERRTA
jgi:uncharacterized protein DUF6284